MVGIELITYDYHAHLTIMVYMNCNIEHRYSIIMAVKCENKGCYIIHGELKLVYYCNHMNRIAQFHVPRIKSQYTITRPGTESDHN